MRVDDRAIPDVFLDPVPILADWPVRPVFGLDTGLPPSYWDTPEQTWDDTDAFWDGGWADATCAFNGCEIDTGEPDEAGLFPSARLLLQLDNKTGEWSTLNPDGTTNRFGPGTEMVAYAHNAESDWWLFHGFISRYDQRADDTIEVEAFDCFSDLAQAIGTYTPGVGGEKMGARLTALLAASGESALRHRFAVGVAALTAQETDAAPLEEMQTVVLSDGGVLFCDADGTLVALDRLWPAGRDDQVAVPVVSANVCTADFVVWDATISSNDDSLADYVSLENVAKLRSVAGAQPGFKMAFTEQQWTTQTEGDILAAFLLELQQPRQLSIEEFTLYLNDPNQPELWRAVDWRRLDHLRFLHNQRVTGGGTLRVDVTAVLDSLTHEITPEGWSMVVSTAKVRAFTEPIFYDSGVIYNDTPPEGYGF
jgi:hypothetical protein